MALFNSKQQGTERKKKEKSYISQTLKPEPRGLATLTMMKTCVCRGTSRQSTSSKYKLIGAQQVAKVATARASMKMRRRFASDCRLFFSSDSLHMSAPCRAMILAILTYTTSVMDSGSRYCVMNTSTVSIKGKLKLTRGCCTMHRVNSRPWNLFTLTRLKAA